MDDLAWSLPGLRPALLPAAAEVGERAAAASPSPAAAVAPGLASPKLRRVSAPPLVPIARPSIAARLPGGSPRNVRRLRRRAARPRFFLRSLS